MKIIVKTIWPILMLTLHLTAQDNRSLSISSDGDFVEIGVDSSFSPQEFTIELWYKRYSYIDNTISSYPLYTTGDLTINLGGHSFPQGIIASFGGENNFNLFTPLTLFPDRWYHVAVTSDDEEFRLYLDGNLMDSITTEWSFTFQDIIHIGTWIGSYLHGEIDELRYWNVARKDSEILNAMHDLPPGDRSGLIGYWK